MVSTAAELLATQAGGTFAFTTGPAAPLWPLGFGLSYSTFIVGNVSLSVPAGGGSWYGPNETFTLTANVSSTGPAGALSLQVYYEFAAIPSFEARSVGRRLVLLCFAKQALPADARGELIDVACSTAGLGRWDLALGDYAVAGGVYRLVASQFAGDAAAGVAYMGVDASPPVAERDGARARARRYVDEMTLRAADV